MQDLQYFVPKSQETLMPRKGKDHLKPGTPAFIARQARWRHNGLMGSARMAEVFLFSVMESKTATIAAKKRAVATLKELDLLKLELKTRVEPDAISEGPIK